jgi:hypothetical protein
MYDNIGKIENFKHLKFWLITNTKPINPFWTIKLNLLLNSLIHHLNPTSHQICHHPFIPT